jgi:lipoyl(octanoyl) transferase
MTPSPESGPASGSDACLEVRRLGRTAYAEAHALQQDLLAQRIDGAIGDMLLLTEHEPVITLGRGSTKDSVAGLELPVIEVERGGEATYHGPGQVVAYPILALPEDRRDLHRYLRDLEEVVIGVLAEFDVEGRRSPGETGVWIGSEKVCSVGVAVRRWVTWHGFALNVNTDLAAFRGFRPCGLDPDVMTRLADHAELPPASILVEVLVVKHFCRVFDLELPPMPIPEPSDDAGTCGGPPGFPSLPILPS